MPLWSKNKTSDTGNPLPTTTLLDPLLQAEVDEGLREFRLTGTALNPMYPVRLEMLESGPTGLAVRVTIQDTQSPVPVTFDHVYHFVLDQLGGVTVYHPYLTILDQPEHMNFGVWGIIYGVQHLESACFMWCVRREAGNPGKASPALSVYVRWLNGQP